MRILVGSAGSSTGYGVIKCLRHAFGNEVFILATDTNPEHLIAAATLTDAYAQVATGQDPAYPVQIDALVKEHQLDTVFPIHNTEVEALSIWTPANPGTNVVAPNAEAVDLCNDKLRGFTHLSQHGVPVPHTELASADTRVGDPGVLAKPRQGVGSSGVLLCRTSAELSRLLSSSDLEYIVQSVCEPPETTIDVINVGKLFYCVCRERLEVKAGVCTKARVFQDATATELVRALSHVLGLTGAFCVQTMTGPAGEPMFTDVNPRLGGGTSMTLPLGINLPAALIAHLNGRDPRPYLPELAGEHFVVRQYEEFLTR